MLLLVCVGRNYVKLNISCFFKNVILRFLATIRNVIVRQFVCVVLRQREREKERELKKFKEMPQPQCSIIYIKSKYAKILPLGNSIQFSLQCTRRQVRVFMF